MTDQPQPPQTQRLPRRRISMYLSIALALTLCIAVTVAVHLHTRAHRFNQLVAVSWGQPDPNGPPALFGAYVWLQGQGSSYQAKLSVYIDRPTLLASYQFEERTLGTASSPEDAVARWGQLRWTAQGLHIGPSAQELLIPATDFAQYR